VNAFIYFYKKDNTHGERILVKEVPDIGTHEHVINGDYFKESGWVSLEITNQVAYWTEDYGISESRTLKLVCTEGCTELLIEHCDSKSLPFLSLEMNSKKKI